MGTVAQDDFFTGTSAGAAGGTTTIIDFVIPNPKQSLIEAYRTMARLGREGGADYSFHVAVTWWYDQVHDDMGTLVQEHGVNSFKHFMAYKDAIMVDDERPGEQLRRARRSSARCRPCTPRTASSFSSSRRRCSSQGITGPEGHPLSRPPARSRARPPSAPSASPMCWAAPLYIVHVSTAPTRSRRSPARAADGQRVFGEVAGPATRRSTSRSTGTPTGRRRRRLRDEPAVPREAPPGCALGRARRRPPADHRDRSLLLLRAAEGAGPRRLHQDPERHRRHRRPHVGPLAPRRRHRPPDAERVRPRSPRPTPRRSSTSTRARARSGREPTPTSWSGTRSATQTISATTHHRRSTSTSIEGMEVTGLARYTLSQGKLVWTDGDLRTERGAGRYVKRPASRRCSRRCGARPSCTCRSRSRARSRVSRRYARTRHPRRPPDGRPVRRQLRRRPSAADPGPGADRGRALLLLLRRAVHPGLPDRHRHPVLHPTHRRGQPARRGARDPRGERLRRHVRARLPDRGAVRTGLRAQHA